MRHCPHPPPEGGSASATPDSSHTDTDTSPEETAPMMKNSEEAAPVVESEA